MQFVGTHKHDAFEILLLDEPKRKIKWSELHGCLPRELVSITCCKSSIKSNKSPTNYFPRGMMKI